MVLIQLVNVTYIMYNQVLPTQKKKKSKILITTLGISSFLIVSLLLVTFIRFGSQSVLAMTLDGVGAHRAALMVDYVNAKGVQAFNIPGSLDPQNAETCEAIYTTFGSQLFDSAAISGESAVQITPLRSEYKDKYSIQSYNKGGIDIAQNKAHILNNTIITVNPNQLSEEFDADIISNYGDKASISIEAEGILNGAEAGYIAVRELSLQSEDFNLSGSLNGWYKQDFATIDGETVLTATQKEGIYELTELGNEVFLEALQPNNYLSEDTKKQLFGSSCSSINSIEILSPESKTFGFGKYATTKQVRPVKIDQNINLNNLNYYETMAKSLEDQNNILNDSKLRDLIKSKYAYYIRAFDAGNKIEDAGFEKLSEEDYKLEVDSFIDDQIQSNKENIERNQENANLAAQLNEQSEIKVETNIEQYYYLDIDTMEFYGTSQKITIKFNDQSGSDLFDRVAQDGIIIIVDTYNLAFGTDVNLPDAPADSKPFENLFGDLEQTPFAKEATTISNEINAVEEEQFEESQDFANLEDFETFEDYQSYEEALSAN